MRSVGIAPDRYITRFSIVCGHDGTLGLIQADLITRFLSKRRA